MELLKSFSALNLFNNRLYSRTILLGLQQTRGYAARKGTREKAAKKKVKAEIKKVGFIPHNLREKKLEKKAQSRRINDSFKPAPIDNVWATRFYRWKVYNFEEAVQGHRETHHPEIYNRPNDPLKAFIELDLTGVKKNKYVEPFTKIAKIPHPFHHGENRSVLVFCKTQEVKTEAEAAGADIVGDADLIKKIERGDLMLPDFQFILAHPNILAELISLKGVLRKKFPTPKNGTLGPDLGDLVRTFKTGIQYWALRDESELDYGWVDTSIGTLDMKTSELEANFKALLEDINSKRPKRDGPFITKAILKCEPSSEKFKIDLEAYMKEPEKEVESDSDDEEVTKRVNA